MQRVLLCFSGEWKQKCISWSNKGLGNWSKLTSFEPGIHCRIQNLDSKCFTTFYDIVNIILTIIIAVKYRTFDQISDPWFVHEVGQLSIYKNQLFAFGGRITTGDHSNEGQFHKSRLFK